jgi:hypothetical protein
MPPITPSLFVSFVNNFCNICAIILNSIKEGKSSVMFVASRTGDRQWAIGRQAIGVRLGAMGIQRKSGCLIRIDVQFYLHLPDGQCRF